MSVRTHIRGSQSGGVGGGGVNRGGGEIKLPLQGTGNVVRQDINSEKTKSPSAVLSKCRRSY